MEDLGTSQLIFEGTHGVQKRYGRKVSSRDGQLSSSFTGHQRWKQSQFNCHIYQEQLHVTNGNGHHYTMTHKKYESKNICPDSSTLERIQRLRDYTKWLLQVGNGMVPTVPKKIIKVPQKMT